VIPGISLVAVYEITQTKTGFEDANLAIDCGPFEEVMSAGN
jgi:hypothetical protein